MTLSLLLTTIAFIRWPFTHLKAWFINALLDILTSGPTPTHIAFVMDGNRRYAEKLGKKGTEGHPIGVENMFRVVRLCQRLRIQCVSAYMFAIDNFKRSKEEVDGLMKLFIGMVTELRELCNELGIRVNVLGRQELFPHEVQVALSWLENETRHNSTMTFNLCAPYASQDEIVTAVQNVIQKAIDSEDPYGSTITEDAIASHLSTSLVGSPPLDILIRTSGIKRLSGFLTWQCCENTQIHVVDAYWPELGFFHLAPIFLEYQRKVWSEEKRCPASSPSAVRTAG